MKTDELVNELPVEFFNSPNEPNDPIELLDSTPSIANDLLQKKKKSIANDQIHRILRNCRPPTYLKNYHYSLPSGPTHSNSVSSGKPYFSLHTLLILLFHHNIMFFLQQY